MIESKLALYVLMRTDLDSMNCGKACAQATHAANQFIHESKSTQAKEKLVKDWEGESGYGFGTTIILGVTEVEMRSIIELVSDNFHSGITHDPSYPLHDGDTLHLIPLDTCAYVFGYKDKLLPFLSELELY